MADIFDLFAKIAHKSTPASNVSYLIVGLGNPGSEYEGTRHNAGFMCVDRLADKLGVKINNVKFRSLTCDAVISGVRVLLMKPQTYMNLSGDAVGEAARFYKIAPEHIIVICDDVNFDVGFMRIRLKGSAGGHNGLKDIIAKAGGEGFIRIKIGVGKKPNPEYDLASWVLGKFSDKDKKVLDEVRDNAALAIEEIISGHPDTAMNKYSK